MSFEKDITVIKQMVEAGRIFKPATPDQIQLRKDAEVKNKTAEQKVRNAEGRYYYDELSDQAKQRAISNHCYTNVDYEWWEWTYEDAATIGLKITGFDIDRGSYCSGKLLWSIADVINKIMKEHGPDCETYKTAQRYQQELAKIDEDDYDAIDDLEEEFVKELCEDYRIILSKEYDYLTGEEAVAEHLCSNDNEFDENGDDW